MGDSSVPYYMNSPKTDSAYKSTPDTSKIRLKNFAKCLNRLLNEFKNNPRIADINTMLVPGYIGCDRGGGVWSFYKSEIIKFAYGLSYIKQDIRVKIVHFKKTVKILDIGNFFLYDVNYCFHLL